MEKDTYLVLRVTETERDAQVRSEIKLADVADEREPELDLLPTRKQKGSTLLH